MKELHAVSMERHGNKCWRRSSYSFAAKESIAMVGSQELPKLALAAPIAFIAVDTTYVPVALQGLVQGQNLFVAADGSWLGKYIPVQYRSYPFRLARRSENDDFILCVDEEAVLSGSDEGEPFFGADGKAAPAVADIFNQLLVAESDRKASKRIHELLRELELVEPWAIKIQKEDGTSTTLDGLFRIRETRIKELAPEQLVMLRDCGAFLVIYCQLLSMQNLPVLGNLAAERNRPKPPAQMSPATTAALANTGMLGDSGVLSFENLR